MLQQVIVQGPFKGIVNNQPRPLKDPKSWDDLLNMLPWKGRLITRPRLNASSTSPDSATIRLMVSYQDILASRHNLVLTTKNAYMITSGPTWHALGFPGGVTTLDGTALPYGYAITVGRVYFSNGSCVGLYSDGEANLKSSNHPGAWRSCFVLANHLVTCHTTEPAPGSVGSTDFPYRVRWSANGDPNTWTTGAGSTAGSTDLLEVPDPFTGGLAIGRSGYIFRTNGITLMTPTGIGTSPFQFDQVSNAPKGVGNFYPYSLDSYGNIAAFLSQQDVYLFDGTTFTPIGGEAKKAIYADIGTTDPSSIFGCIIPRLGPRFDSLSYYLSLPSAVDGSPIAWVYQWDEQAWWRFRSSSGPLTAISNLVI